MIEKIFTKVMIMIVIIIVDLFVVPYLIGAASTLFLALGILVIMLSFYAELKIILSFFKEKK